jgi:hypothetical protein
VELQYALASMHQIGLENEAMALLLQVLAQVRALAQPVVAQARPGQARPGQARPGQARPGQATTAAATCSSNAIYVGVARHRRPPGPRPASRPARLVPP